jgi:hypothetical protein
MLTVIGSEYVLLELGQRQAGSKAWGCKLAVRSRPYLQNGSRGMERESETEWKPECDSSGSSDTRYPSD